MQQEGCMPNIVTYNTLIDVYGKLGQWQEALGVLETLRMEVGSRGLRFSSKLQPAPPAVQMQPPADVAMLVYEDCWCMP